MDIESALEHGNPYAAAAPGTVRNPHARIETIACI